MKVLASCLLLFLVGCAGKMSVVEEFISNSKQEEAPLGWADGQWKIEVKHKYDEFNYSFTGKFSDSRYQYDSCLSLPWDEYWMELQIPAYEDDRGVQKDLAAAYKVEGA